MLAFSFFIAFATSVAWLFCFGFYVNMRIPDFDFMAMGPSEIVLYMLVALFPLFILWSLWGKFCSWHHESMLQKQFALLSKQIHQNQEYSDVIARILLKNGQQQSHVYALGKIELYIGEMNEILADILGRYGFVDEKNLC